MVCRNPVLQPSPAASRCMNIMQDRKQKHNLNTDILIWDVGIPSRGLMCHAMMPLLIINSWLPTSIVPSILGSNLKFLQSSHFLQPCGTTISCLLIYPQTLDLLHKASPSKQTALPLTLEKKKKSCHMESCLYLCTSLPFLLDTREIPPIKATFTGSPLWQSNLSCHLWHEHFISKCGFKSWLPVSDVALPMSWEAVKNALNPCYPCGSLGWRPLLLASAWPRLV